MQGQLDLLLLDDDNQGKNHFNFKKIIAVEAETKSKSRRKRKLQLKKKIQEGEQNDDDGFQVNVEDTRFSALFSSHHYNIDPSEPNFKRTKGMESIIQAKQKQKIALDDRVVKNEGQKSSPGEEKKTKNRAELEYLINSIKNKTKSLKLKRNR